MKDGQNSAVVAASACGVKTPAYDGSKSPAKAKIAEEEQRAWRRRPRSC